ncbi:hypothetical protein [Nocardia sp. AB354]|uniref:hypothetical protein n=1 Tax=Nocardia sp. AB354 TaxID=3413283 RepID=UPI003C136E60
MPAGHPVRLGRRSADISGAEEDRWLDAHGWKLVELRFAAPFDTAATVLADRIRDPNQ